MRIWGVKDEVSCGLREDVWNKSLSHILLKYSKVESYHNKPPTDFSLS